MLLSEVSLPKRAVAAAWEEPVFSAVQREADSGGGAEHSLTCGAPCSRKLLLSAL